MTDPGLVTRLRHLARGRSLVLAKALLDAADALAAAKRREQALERFVQHGDCAKWGPLSEHPRHLHSTIACTCGLIAALARAEPPEAKS